MRTALLWRQSGLWALSRLVHAVFGAVAVSAPDVSAANALGRPQPAVVLLCMALGAVELIRRRERLLLGNLGIGAWQVAGLLAAPPLAAEVLVAITGGR